MTAQFSQLPIGAHFEFRARRYVKLGLSVAGGEDRIGHAFLGYTEVLPAENTDLLPLPSRRSPCLSWTDHLAPAPPGQAKPITPEPALARLPSTTLDPDNPAGNAGAQLPPNRLPQQGKSLYISNALH